MSFKCLNLPEGSRSFLARGDTPVRQKAAPQAQIEAVLPVQAPKLLPPDEPASSSGTLPAPLEPIAGVQIKLEALGSIKLWKTSIHEDANGNLFEYEDEIKLTEDERAKFAEAFQNLRLNHRALKSVDLMEAAVSISDEQNPAAWNDIDLKDEADLAYLTILKNIAKAHIEPKGTSFSWPTYNVHARADSSWPAQPLLPVSLRTQTFYHDWNIERSIEKLEKHWKDSEPNTLYQRINRCCLYKKWMQEISQNIVAKRDALKKIIEDNPADPNTANIRKKMNALDELLQYCNCNDFIFTASLLLSEPTMSRLDFINGMTLLKSMTIAESPVKEGFKAKLLRQKEEITFEERVFFRQILSLSFQERGEGKKHHLHFREDPKEFPIMKLLLELEQTKTDPAVHIDVLDRFFHHPAIAPIMDKINDPEIERSLTKTLHAAAIPDPHTLPAHEGSLTHYYRTVSSLLTTT